MHATDSYLLLRALVDEFARCGMRHACTSPGSRNSPIILSLVRDGRIRCWSHVDERCAGFFALGAAKASGAPVAVTCTSGTAAANLYPAVIEAQQAGVPLIVLSADRPPELRDVGAGQAIDQLKLYGYAVKWFFELDLPDAEPQRLRFIRALACRAYWTALDGQPGPVHLNVPLREPLVVEEPLPDDATGRAGGRPYVPFERREGRAAGDDAIDPAGDDGHPSGRIVIVAGAGTQNPARVAALAQRLMVPLIADPLSGARRGAAAIAHYDLILRDEAFAATHRPQFVLRLGELPTSKPLRTWLAGLTDAAQIAFDPGATWRDPAAVVGLRLAGDLPGPRTIQADPEWLAAWRRADAAASAATAAPLAESGLSEPAVARTLGESLPPDATLFVASSMPIRDVESWFPVRDDPPRVLSNRGANGIDGTVSAAFGAAAVSSGPVVLLIGDVALAHDIGGLLAARRTGLSITIVLLNNAGGAIFDFVAVARQDDAFEEHIATPTGLDFSAAAVLFGCTYEAVDNVERFTAALRRSLAGGATTLIEVRTDRAANHELHTRMERSVAALGSEARSSQAR